MNQTGNYELNQWAETDRIQMEDFNSDNEKIDAALKSSADAVTALQTAVAKCGNCKIYTTSYTGAGGYGSSKKISLTFEAQPVLVIVISQYGKFMLAHPGSTSFPYDNTTSSISWSGNTISWYSTSSSGAQFNSANTTYYVVALIAKS